MCPVRTAARLALAATLLATSATAEQATILQAEADTQEAFFDGLVPGLLSAHNVPGAVVSVVNGERIVFAKGWGLADVERRTPMDPATTRMRVASVSKLFTATAAMQLVEQGKLDLHADVNDLLDFEIESPFDEPITLHHLLTHTPGFDDRFLGTSRPHGEEPVPLGDYLRVHMPPVVMPPGVTISYSNHGLALVGRLVELASGQPLAEYVEEHVLAPLEMRSTTFHVPHPVRDDQARPYLWNGTGFEELWFERLNDWPAGDLDTTALDMANFAIAHLHGGAYRGRRILAPETAERMLSQQFRHDPRLPGWCYGFSEVVGLGFHGIGHGGWVIGFHTRFLLFPEDGVGLFVSINGESPGSFHTDLLKAIAGRSGAGPPDTDETTTGPADADAWVGTYLPNRRVRSTWMKTMSLAQHVTVARDGTGTLILSSPLGASARLRLLEPDLAVDEESGALMVLRVGPHTGRPQIVTSGNALDRVRGLERPQLHAVLWSVAAVFGLTTVLGWLLGGLARRTLGAAPSPLTRSARLGGLVAASLLVALPGGIVAHLNDVPSAFRLWLEVPPLVSVALWVPFPLAALGLALPVWAATGIRPGVRAPLPRLHYWLLVALTWGLIASAWSMQIRGPWSS